MRLTIWLLLAATCLPAQTLPWVDISGTWLRQDGDDARYAAPDWDDTGWKPIFLPSSRVWTPPVVRDFWLRKAVDLPEAVARQKLALTLGKIAENYELSVNGIRVATVGSFAEERSEIARPRSFVLPPLSGNRLTIAIRCRTAPTYGTRAWAREPDPGPYLVTGEANAPRLAEPLFIHRLRMIRSPDLAAGVALATLGLMLLLMYLNQPTQPELLWLSLHSWLLAIIRLQIVLLITPDSTPWRSRLLVTGGLDMALLLEFIMATLSMPPRWVRFVIWPTALAGLIPALDQVAVPYRVLQLASVAVFVWALRPQFRQAAGYSLILTGSILIFLANVLSNRPPFEWMRIPVLTVGPYEASSYVVGVSVFTLVLVLVLIRRLLADSARKQRLEGEFEAARSIQNLLLSHSLGNSPHLPLDTAYQPAQEVGGDFYWTRNEPDGSLTVVLGDVSGKGLKAAMLVSMAIGILRQEKSGTPGAILAALNDGLAGQMGGGFVTCCCARFHPAGTVTLASAGHPAPYADGHELEVATGLPLGIAPDVSYEESTATGSQFTFVSDGVIEAENAQRELFGFDRTREISSRSAQEIADAAKAWGQNDDITVVTVRRNA